MGSQIRVQEDESGEIEIFFPYNPAFAEKIKSIKGHRRLPDDKYWSFPNTNGTLDKILKAFEGEEIHIDPTLKSDVSVPSLRGVPKAFGTTKQAQIKIAPRAGGSAWRCYGNYIGRTKDPDFQGRSSLHIPNSGKRKRKCP